MRNIIFGLLALGVAGFFWFTNPSDDNEWLYGTWTIDKQVEQTVVTNMVFREDGSMSLGNESRVVYDNCTYEFFTRGTIDFTCMVNGRRGTFPLKVNLEETLITDTNENTFRKS